MSFESNPAEEFPDPHGECAFEIHRLEAENTRLRAELAAMESTRTDAVNNAVKWADESDLLRQQLDSVKAELAAIRDAGDKEILNLGGMYQQAETGFERLQICGKIQYIAKARGLKIAEQATLIECLKMDVLAAYAGSDEDIDKRCEEYTRALPGTLLPDDASPDLLYCGGEIFRDGVFEGFARQAKKIAEQAKEIERLNADVDRLDNAWNGMFLEWQQQTYMTKRTAEERDEAIGLLKWLVELDALETDLKEYAKNPTAKSAKRILELTAKREEK